MLTLRIAQAMSDLLSAGEDLVYMVVLSKSGSAPSSADARMLMRADGSFIGTVGGGKVEADAQKRAAHVFKTRSAEEFAYELTSADVAGTEMICGGRVRLLLDFIEGSPANAAVLRDVNAALKAGKKCYLAARLGAAGDSLHVPLRRMIAANGTTTDEFPLAPERLDALLEKARRSIYPVLETIAGERFVVERCFVPSTVFVLGAGHVGQQVATVAKIADFRTVVLDDRSEYACHARFPDADVVKVIDSFENSLQSFDINGDSYVVIVTRGHMHDKAALAQALRAKAGYVGMIGSRTKRDTIYKALLQEGFTADDLARVHCPIGLDIGGGLPGEIAVSIVAEIIQVRAEAVG